MGRVQDQGTAGMTPWTPSVLGIMQTSSSRMAVIFWICNSSSGGQEAAAGPGLCPLIRQQPTSSSSPSQGAWLRQARLYTTATASWWMVLIAAHQTSMQGVACGTNWQQAMQLYSCSCSNASAQHQELLRLKLSTNPVKHAASRVQVCWHCASATNVVLAPFALLVHPFVACAGPLQVVAVGSRRP